MKKAMFRSSAAAMISWSRIEPPGATIAVTPASARMSMPSRNGKEGVGGGAAVDDRKDGLGSGEPARVHAAHLAGADADRLARVGEHDRVRLDAPRDLPRELAGGPLDG